MKVPIPEEVEATAMESAMPLRQPQAPAEAAPLNNEQDKRQPPPIRVLPDGLSICVGTRSMPDLTSVALSVQVHECCLTRTVCEPAQTKKFQNALTKTQTVLGGPK